MEHVDNPFAPGAGSPPPELVGREDVLRQAETLFARIKRGRAEKSMFLTGLRGVGKTVLLNRMNSMSEDAGYRSILIEASEDRPMVATLVPALRQSLFQLNAMASAGHKMRRAWAVFRSFVGTVKISINDISVGLDIDAESGAADSGQMEFDLPNVFVAIAEAAQERQTAIAIFIDEVQCLNKIELGALIMAMHAMQQRQLPLVFVGAGLPALPSILGNTRTYAERLFVFPRIEALPQATADVAVRKPLNEKQVRIDRDALAEIFRMTRGYPYFIQEWGYQAWNCAPEPLITVQVIKQASQIAIDRLDENFFRVRFSRLTP